MFGAFALLNNADDLIENAWRERNWLNFVYVSLVVTAGIMIVGFLICMVGGAIYLEGSRVYLFARSLISPASGTASLAAITGHYPGLFYFSLSFSAVIGFFSLISAPPAMLVKSIVGSLSDLLFSFEGRIDRMSWVLTAIVTGGVMLALALVIYLMGGAVGESSHMAIRTLLDLLWLILVVLVVPAIWVVLAISNKRLHDRGKAGWWLLVFLVLPAVLYAAAWVKAWSGFSLPLTIGAAALAFWGLAELAGLRGAEGANRYGDDPLAGSA